LLGALDPKTGELGLDGECKDRGADLLVFHGGLFQRVGLLDQAVDRDGVILDGLCHSVSLDLGDLALQLGDALLDASLRQQSTSSDACRLAGTLEAGGKGAFRAIPTVLPRT
jgi:hypothetical protein